MSVLNTTNMFNNQLNSFNSGRHMSHSYNELSNKLKANMASNKLPQPLSPYSANDIHYVKKRSYSDLLKESSGRDSLKNQENKRSRTAPPSPPSQPYDSKFPVGGLPKLNFKSMKTNGPLRSRSLSPNKKFVACLSPSNSPSLPNTPPQSSPSRKPTLPSISTVLESTPMASKAPLRLKPITPTVSLDYFDTYKPNDENWRYGLLDTINKGPNQFNLSQYDYLNKHRAASSSLTSSVFTKDRPSFNSKISSKIIENSSPRVNTFEKSNYPPCIQGKIYSERKINFPYESNYTYLNKTYLNDVERYPEYLELAHSLIQLSKPQLNAPVAPHSQPVIPLTSNASSADKQIDSMYKHEPIYPPITTPPSSTRLPNAQPHSQYNSFLGIISEGPTTPPAQNERKTEFIPVTPPSSKSKSRSELLKSSPRQQHQHPRVCISCGSDQSPCWRPSWSTKEGQLCNSCGLRYKKTSARCLNDECKKIPAKGEWSLMQSKGKTIFEDGIEGHSCLDCGWRVEVKK